MWAKQFESEDGINTAVTVSLRRLSKYEYTVTVYHMGGKSVWTGAGDSTLSTGNIRKHSGIPSVIIWCYYSKANTKLPNWATYMMILQIRFFFLHHQYLACFILKRLLRTDT